MWSETARLYGMCLLLGVLAAVASFATLKAIDARVEHDNPCLLRESQVSPEYSLRVYEDGSLFVVRHPQNGDKP